MPTGYNDLFAGSGECLMCHDSQQNLQGQSVGIIQDWRATMMANAARDPFWRAKVSHEGLVNPEHKEELENVCTRCHAPTGNENAHYNGQALYSIEEMVSDPIAMDGVQCSVCHQIPEESLGNFSGTFLIGTNKEIFGPYENPLTGPMINFTGYTPVHSAHIRDSRLCASCHTLITNSVDNNGNLTGNQFVEQAIYQEWENSSFSAMGESCQTCHVPEIDDPVKISSMPAWLEPRTPFGMHQFGGANVFMTRIIKENGAELGVTANEVQFDSVISRNFRMLQENALNIELQELNRTADTLFVDLKLINMAGHKFPGGYPSRRAFVELVVVNENGQEIFHSGEMNDDFQILNEDDDYEMHYNTINSGDQVQIYEMVMGDVNYDVTTVLERANFHLKDNRLPPSGFTTSHYAYDTAKIVGNALDDPDFNKENNVEGSGSDIVHFHIPIETFQGNFNVVAKVHYQTVSSKWLEHMFSYSSDEIDLFKSYYEDADKTPVLVAEAEIVSVATEVDELQGELPEIYPNPTFGNVFIDGGSIDIQSVKVYGGNGREFPDIKIVNLNDGRTKLAMPLESGIYFIKIQTVNAAIVRKVVVY